MRKVRPRDMRRMMHKLGIAVEEIPNVNEVIIKASDRTIILKEPQVALMKVGGQTIYEITGQAQEVKEEVVEAAVPEEDVQLVASQTSVSLEEARKALIMSKGDIAQAIFTLKLRKGS